MDTDPTSDVALRPSRDRRGRPRRPWRAPTIAGLGSRVLVASAGGDDSAKDYSTMTKSEKMSASMKSECRCLSLSKVSQLTVPERWQNGSMQNAVNKRKATLAAKKAAAAATAAASTPISTPPAPAQQVVSVPPQRLHAFINMHSQQQGRF